MVTNATVRPDLRVKIVSICQTIVRANHVKMVLHASMKLMATYANVDQDLLVYSAKVYLIFYVNYYSLNKSLSVHFQLKSMNVYRIHAIQSELRNV